MMNVVFRCNADTHDSSSVRELLSIEFSVFGLSSTVSKLANSTKCNSLDAISSFRSGVIEWCSKIENKLNFATSHHSKDTTIRFYFESTLFLRLKWSNNRRADVLFAYHAIASHKYLYRQLLISILQAKFHLQIGWFDQNICTTNVSID